MPNLDETDWDETSPALNQPRRAGAQEITSLRKGVRARMAKEHVEPDTAGVGGEHLEGSAIIYRGTSAPTLRPDGATALDTDDDGRLWMDATPRKLYLWNGSSWIPVTAIAQNDSFTKENPSLALPLTQTGLTNGTWMVFVDARLNSGAAGAISVSITVNGVQRTLEYVNVGAASTLSRVPLLLPFIVPLSGATAGFVSVTAASNCQVLGMTGFRTSPPTV